MKHALVRAGAVSLIVLASGCSVLDGDKVEYKSAVKAPSLDIPPDLTRPSADPRYVIPASGSMSASEYEGRTANVPAQTTALNSLGTLRLERQGQERWLVDNRPPEVLWESLVKFWKDSGFNLVLEDRAMGLIETDWAENRAKIPQDFIRRTIGKVLDGLYSSGLQDKYRVRLERNAAGGTDIYVTHRGMEEVARNKVNTTEVIWVPRASDPELEAEFMRRMMVTLGGASAQQAAAALQVSPKQTTSRAIVDNGVPLVQLDDGFDRAWRRVGLSLDRTGFTVEDRDRSQGLYYVRYVEPVIGEDKDPGFFARMFGNSKSRAPVKYRILVKSAGEVSTVQVLNDKGAAEASAAAKQIVDLLVADLK